MKVGLAVLLVFLLVYGYLAYSASQSKDAQGIPAAAVVIGGAVRQYEIALGHEPRTLEEVERFIPLVSSSYRIEVQEVSPGEYVVNYSGATNGTLRYRRSSFGEKHKYVFELVDY